MKRTVTSCAPELFARRSVGHDSAEALLIAVGDYPAEMKIEASSLRFAASAPSNSRQGERLGNIRAAAETVKPTRPCIESC